MGEGGSTCNCSADRTAIPFTSPITSPTCSNPWRSTAPPPKIRATTNCPSSDLTVKPLKTESKSVYSSNQKMETGYTKTSTHQWLSWILPKTYNSHIVDFQWHLDLLKSRVVKNNFQEQLTGISSSKAV